jgi:hypothetical protein
VRAAVAGVIKVTVGAVAAAEMGAAAAVVAAARMVEAVATVGWGRGARGAGMATWHCRLHLQRVSTPSAKKSLAVGRVAPLSAQVVA